MRRLIVVLMMLSPVMAMGQAKAAKKFPLTVHVTASRYAVLAAQFGDSGGDAIDELSVTIEGKKYLLAVPLGLGRSLLLPGDYKARVRSDKHPNPYVVLRQYELLLPDGKTMKAQLMGVME